jgi:hypothetical protein
MARHTLLAGNKPRAAMAILRRVCLFVAERFNPAKMKAYRPNRGILADQLDGMAKKARQQIGAKHVSKQIRDRTLSAMVAAAKGLIDSKLDISKEEIIAATKLSRATVFRRWNELILSLAEESHSVSSKKEQDDPAEEKKSSSLSSFSSAAHSDLVMHGEAEANTDLESWLSYHDGCPVDFNTAWSTDTSNIDSNSYL